MYIASILIVREMNAENSANVPFNLSSRLGFLCVGV